MNQTENKAASMDPIIVVSGSDEAYAMPLAVTLRSAIESLAEPRSMQLYIFDGGMTDESKRRIADSCNNPRVAIQFIEVSMSTLSHLPVDGHISSSAYLRLLIPQILPTSIDRAIYLDSDLIVCRDLGELWDLPLNRHLVLAAQDSAAPYIDAAIAMKSYTHFKRFLASPLPIANYKSLSLDPCSKYFNTGVLLIDVDRWRRERIDAQLFECLEKHREHVLWWDQYALNVVLYGRWGELNPQWNQGAQVHLFPSHHDSPFDRETYTRLMTDPWVIHFTSPSKPWHYYCRHPAKRLFQRHLAKTAWAHFEAEKPNALLRTWWKHHTKAVKIEFRRRKNMARHLFDSDRRAA
ncbi:glycosyltransferase family 8 protein [Novipirellula artificiosorum]|uniref:General stress protein A n=1 Tax=Novipirellula artificiosorum TaxID=2528016 RepID=A0A5C6DJ43_9BACT|nr:glycosyltransferase family 8 protein [Novipirellula artificiosorum]TWU37413.1 General stress protein A [Novipirellula artificiosorum]